jgi:tetratricopeptide repeat protein/DUF2914 family protein
MWEAPEPGSILQAAELAAEAGNYTAAEHLLREAARQQEASLGPRHPELANTLNNLGIVCELTDKPDEAEQYFRRAVSIARTSLAPDHPFVATSQKNLRDFCEARGRKVDIPAAPTFPNTTQEATAPTLPKPAQEVTATIDPVPSEAPELPAKTLFYRVAIGALGPIAMLMVVLAAGLPRLGRPDQAAPPPAVAVVAPKAIVPPPDPALPRQPAPPLEPASPPEPALVEDVPKPVATTAKTTPAVLIASLCAELEDWLCDPADRPVPPSGQLFFYTQIRSASATTVQHRWYQDDRLQHSVTLRVEPNRSGYRTFSRSLMTSDSAGSWRVELRGEDGTLLHEERFTVR